MSRYNEIDADRMILTYLQIESSRFEAEASSDLHPAARREVVPQRSARRIGLVAPLAAALAVVAMVGLQGAPVDNAANPPASSPETSRLPPLALLARPDVSAPMSNSAAWVERGRGDAIKAAVEADSLVPLLVHADGNQTYIWYRDYRSGNQLLVQYAGESPDSAVLVDFSWPSSKLAGPSHWEQERVANAVRTNAEIALKVGSPVQILDVGIEKCRDGLGVCAQARLSGPVLAAPSSAPALAPIANVDLTSLEVSVDLPTPPTPEVKPT